jgi:hypothetical protein
LSGPDTPAANAGPPRYATLARFAEVEGVSVYTAHRYVRQGLFPVYRLPGQKAVCVNLAEARAALARAPRRKVRPGYGDFGPDAVVRDLSNVAGQDFEVLQ